MFKLSEISYFRDPALVSTARTSSWRAGKEYLSAPRPEPEIREMVGDTAAALLPLLSGDFFQVGSPVFSRFSLRLLLKKTREKSTCQKAKGRVGEEEEKEVEEEEEGRIVEAH
ncbi:hypothetical protein RUM43_003923 [Polyplax serrata]|uniref:Uncharacterized protein n=1 Tax=Polyplax serrata TaxID=468196 RepID=A0AAN8S2J3_POLSC